MMSDNQLTSREPVSPARGFLLHGRRLFGGLVTVLFSGLLIGSGILLLSKITAPVLAFLGYAVVFVCCLAGVSYFCGWVIERLWGFFRAA